MKKSNKTVQSAQPSVAGVTNDQLQPKLTEEQLSECAEQLRQLYISAIEAENAIHSAAERALDYAIQMGKILIQVKWSLLRGHFRPWVNKNCQFKYRTAQNYMALTKAQHVALLINAKGLRQAYLEIGLIKPAKKPGQAKHTTKAAGDKIKEDKSSDGDKDQGSESARPDLDLPSKVEEAVDQLEEMTLTHEDDSEIIPLLEPLATLYNQYQKRHQQAPVVANEIDLNARSNEAEPELVAA